jgi:hypothetical protein
MTFHTTFRGFSDKQNNFCQICLIHASSAIRVYDKNPCFRDCEIVMWEKQKSYQMIDRKSCDDT